MAAQKKKKCSTALTLNYNGTFWVPSSVWKTKYMDNEKQYCHGNIIMYFSALLFCPDVHWHCCIKTGNISKQSLLLLFTFTFELI